jgi:2-isopropylmalate synthase
MDKIKIFDTTLRDGEQSPGCSMTINEKIRVAKQLEMLNVDIIEAGFAIVSEGDFNSVKEISKAVKNPTVASLARATVKDIDTAFEAVKYAKNPRIHTFIATSDIHMMYKLKMSKQEVLQRAIDAVKYAKSYVNDVEFSAEDASRSDWDFLVEVYTAAINAGATTINVPDTVGFITPDEMYDMISYIKNNVPNIHKADISVHCHNDLRLAVANSLAAVKAGARQIECTINGIGERAGNAAMEEIVLGMKTRKDKYGGYTDIITEEIINSSRLVSEITNFNVQPNKAIVGSNAFLHESGIHQHGVINNSLTYEIIDPKSIGIVKSNIVLGKHSGHHAINKKLTELGITVSKNDIRPIFTNFKTYMDNNKEITDKELVELALQTIKQSKIQSI